VASMGKRKHTNFRRGHLKVKRPFGRSGCRLDDNIIVDRKRVGWIDMAHVMDI
jgi:hypothetical protein